MILLLACATDPDAPPEIAWDHDTCASCRMLVGDPAHAAAIVTRDGHTLTFDDPACLFRYVVDQRPEIARMWFSDGARWYREDEVAFAHGGTTPMGGGLVAVAAGTPGSIGVGEASAEVVR